MVSAFNYASLALLFMIVFAFVANWSHTWLEFGAGLRRSIALTVALAIGAIASATLCWLLWNAMPGECVDYAPGIYGTC